MPSFRDSNFPAISDHQTDMTGKRNETRSLLEWRTRLRRCPRGIANTARVQLVVRGWSCGEGGVRMCKGWGGGGGGTKQSMFYPKCDFHHRHGQSRNLFSHIQTVMRFVQPLCSFSLVAFNFGKKNQWLWTVWWLFGHKKDHQGDRSWTDKLKNLTSTQKRRFDGFDHKSTLCGSSGVEIGGKLTYDLWVCQTSGRFDVVIRLCVISDVSSGGMTKSNSKPKENVTRRVGSQKNAKEKHDSTQGMPSRDSGSKSQHERSKKWENFSTRASFERMFYWLMKKPEHFIQIWVCPLYVKTEKKKKKRACFLTGGRHCERDCNIRVYVLTEFLCTHIVLS